MKIKMSNKTTLEEKDNKNDNSKEEDRKFKLHLYISRSLNRRRLKTYLRKRIYED
jgi:hypothetical protein